MAPIRVAIIGLSSATGEITASPGDGWAASAHLPYLKASPRYEIVALCNSSVKSAQFAIERHGLPASTKAYGSSEDLAKDPDVDLVVCNVRVDRHHSLMMPILKAGKDAFVEWPLGSNLQEAEELFAAAKASGSKTIVGLQGRASPVIQKIKQLVAEKAIGDLLSSELQYHVGFVADTEPPGVDYMAKKAVGGNLLSILFMHMAEPAAFALGGFDEVSAKLSTRWEKTKLLKSDGTFDKMIDRETADHIIVTGSIKGSNAPITVYTRGGKKFKDTPAMTFRVFGTKGEIRLTSSASTSLAVGGDKIELYDHDTDAVTVVDAPFADVVKDLPPLAKNVGMLYELSGPEGKTEQGRVTFEEAVALHKLLDAIERSDAERKTLKVPA